MFLSCKEDQYLEHQNLAQISDFTQEQAHKFLSYRGTHWDNHRDLNNEERNSQTVRDSQLLYCTIKGQGLKVQ